MLRLSTMLVAIGIVVAGAVAEPPPTVFLQGTLETADGEALPYDEPARTVFVELYAAPAAAEDELPSESLWQNRFDGVTFNQGVFGVYLGTGVGGPLDPSLFEGPRWIVVAVSDDGFLDAGERLMPAIPLASAPYALACDGVSADAVCGEAIGDSCVGTEKIADIAVTTSKLADDAVTAAKIAPDAVGASEIATDAVGSAEITAGAVGSSEIAAGAVGTEDLANNAVTAAKIAANAVGASEIADGTVGAAEIGSNAVTDSELAADVNSMNKITSGLIQTDPHAVYIVDDPADGANQDAALNLHAADNQLMLRQTGSSASNRRLSFSYNRGGGHGSNGGWTVQRRNIDGEFESNLISVRVDKGWLKIAPNNGLCQAGYPLEVGTAGDSSNGNGAHCTAGGIWENGSDRATKTEFTDVDRSEILDKVANLPIQQWRYKGEPAGTFHIGPVAQDFHAAFGLNGDDDRHIGTLDADGIALVAIQSLNDQIAAQARTIASLEQRLADLEARLGCE